MDGLAAKTTMEQQGSWVFPAPPCQPQGQGGSALDEEDEWEIVRINEEKRKRRGDRHKVRGRSGWVPGSELGNAQQLAQEFKARTRAQRRCLLLVSAEVHMFLVLSGGRLRPVPERALCTVVAHYLTSGTFESRETQQIIARVCVLDGPRHISSS